MKHSKPAKKSNLRRFLQMAKAYRGLFVVVLLLSIAMQIIVLVYPRLVGFIIDEVINGKSGYSTDKRLNLLYITTLSIAVLAVINGFINYIQVNYLYKLLWNVIFDLRQKLNWHIQRLSLSFFTKHMTGQLVSRIINDINQVSALVQQGGIALVLDVMIIIVVAIILCVMSPLLFAFSIIFMPFYFFVFLRFNPLIRAVSKHIQRRIAIMSGGIQERLTGMSIIQSFASEEAEHERFTEENRLYTQKVLKNARYSSIVQATTVIIVYLSNAVTLGLGAYFVVKGRLTVGQVVAFMLYLPLFYGPLSRLSQINISIQQALGSLDHIYELLDITPEITNSPHSVKVMGGPGEIVFEDITFSYPNKKGALQNINLTIPAGKNVALIGPSGGGKSTLASLVPRLYDVDSGGIYIDSLDIRETDLTILRSTVGIVQQEPFLFSTTIKENILYGNPVATDDEVIAAAKAANAHDFIQKLPNGYDSMVGEKGINLSVGQRQRICIARTVLKNPRILILDEATSALDSESENLIQQALVKLMENRTSIIIAHRLSTIMGADFVVVIKDGMIMEQGTHTQLWSRGQLYRNLLDQQFSPMLDLVKKAQSDPDFEV